MGRRRSRRRKSGAVSRRKVLTVIGSGITAIGATSLLTESSAFTSLTASRPTSISVAGDESNALVGLNVSSPVKKKNQEELVVIQNNTGETIDVTVSLDDCSQGTLFDLDGSGCSVNLTIEPGISKSVDIEADVADTIPFTISATSSGFSFETTRETTAEAGNSGNGTVADAGGPYSVKEANSIELDGAQSTGNNLSYSWSIIDGDGSLDDELTSTPIYTAPSVQNDTSVTVELTVTDNQGQTDTDTVTISVRKTGSPPNIDSLTITTTGNQNRAFNIQADVSDLDGDLDTVTITATRTQNNNEDYNNTLSVSGSTDSISDTTGQLGNNKEYRIEITVSDKNEASDTESRTQSTG